MGRANIRSPLKSGVTSILGLRKSTLIKPKNFFTDAPTNAMMGLVVLFFDRGISVSSSLFLVSASIFTFLADGSVSRSRKLLGE